MLSAISLAVIVLFVVGFLAGFVYGIVAYALTQDPYE